MTTENCIAGRRKIPGKARLADYAGNRYGRLVAIRFSRVLSKKTFWLFACDCGKEIEVRIDQVKTCNTRSCGCLLKESSSRQAIALATKNVTHGKSRSAEYGVWSDLYERCHNEKSAQYSGYGERGISVCERWAQFENFLADMGQRPSSSHSIGRKDNDGPYSPENCQWETSSQQARNRRINRKITANGKTRLLIEWSIESGLKPSTIAARIKRGWPEDLAVSAPLQTKWPDSVVA